MTTVDFSRSFLTFRIDTLKKPPQTVSHQPPYSLNNARIALDSVCDITEKSTGKVRRFAQGVSCKTERVGVPGEIWLVPNADFVPVVSSEQFLTIKTYAYIGQEKTVMLYGLNKPQPDRQTGKTADAFDSLKIHVQESPATWLETPKAIIAATFANIPLVACTEYETDRYSVAVWYPVKTFNVNERDDVYQTDTGPILFPDLTREPDELVSGFNLAFAAFNCPEWIELIVRVPTKGPGDVMVHHYTEQVRLDGVKNRMFSLGAQ